MIESLHTLPAAAQAHTLPRGGAAPAALEQGGNELPLRTTGRSGGTQQSSPNDEKLRETFDQFVGETFYGTLLKQMRKTQGEPAYFHGGRAEEVFQGQLDQELVEEMSSAGGHELSGAMFDLFQLNRR